LPAHLDSTDTIAAIASPTRQAVRGLVRLSGPQAWSIVFGMWQPDCDQPRPRRAQLRNGLLHVDGLGLPLPASVAFWPAPRTYTGQELAEIHTTGSLPLLNLVLAQCLARGARLAEPGEFTLRAFLSGRLDLTQAEAVLCVIEAGSPAQLQAALRQLAGGLANPIGRLRDRLLDLLAHLEAGLDFTEEPDVDPIGRAALADELSDAAEGIERLVNQLQTRDRPLGWPRVVIVGPPNAGKSCLYNALLGAERALVSPQAGTTRDYLSAACDCDGLRIELVDTAGIETARNPIEGQAQSLGAERAASADLLLVCASPDTADMAVQIASESPRLHVWTKHDLDTSPPPAHAIVTSALAGAGIAELRTAIARALAQRPGEGDLPMSTSARCRDSLTRARDALRAASATVLQEGGDELIALDLRLALEELGKVVGAVVTDDILDRIFSRFCIGK
jgi:tRNA modification GTPase